MDGPPIYVDRSNSGRHLLLLPEDMPLHKKNLDGVTPRAVWLDWEGQRDKYIKQEISPKNVADTMQGLLWRKKQGDDRWSPWARREFTAEMIPGTISYKDGKGFKKTMWLVSGCILHRIYGACFGRNCCFRIVWPSGFDLILSANTPMDCANWFEYLCAMQCPPKEIARARVQLAAGKAKPLGALQLAAIRSQKFKEMRPAGLHKLYLKISHSVSDVFPSLRDDILFGGDQLDPVGEARRWGLGYSTRRYSELPEKHYAAMPSLSPYCEEWEQLLSEFPGRHQEELRRFLVAYDHKASSAAVALRKHIDWRAATFPLRPQGLAKELIKGKCFVHGVDHYGQPVIYYFTSRQDPRARSLEEAVKAIVYRLEQAIARLPNRDGKVTVVVIREGSTAQNRDLDLVLPLSTVLEHHYPQRLHACVVYPAGVIFRTQLSLAGGTALTADTISRVIPLSNKGDLRYYVPSTSLPTDLGGTSAYSFAQDCAKSGSPTLVPPLWALPEAMDYYPPPVLDSDLPVGSPSFGAQQHEESKYAIDGDNSDEARCVDWVCPNCSIKNCKLCRVASNVDSYYGGWRPLDLAKFPDPR